ncbi:MAG TPA: glycosyltransferase [Vicinamibacterales bacterium]|jgi:Glycosyltransferases involved in cell wall biogenesis
MPQTSLVVPCYNEATRLDVQEFTRFAQSGVARLFLVNDGSRDETLTVLREIESAAPGHVTVVNLEQNCGKAEAVRRGLIEALASDSQFVGFWDADLATPFDALTGFLRELEAAPHLEIVIGSRVRLLGRTIDRQASRHYAGRVFATAASLALRLPVYDTQCGAKLFRATDQLGRALATPFLSRWVFDVELLARLGTVDGRYDRTRLVHTVYEFPLAEWRDVAGSKLRMTDFAKSAVDLLKIYRRYVRGPWAPTHGGAPDVAMERVSRKPPSLTS